jgi:hypothetical protein
MISLVQIPRRMSSWFHEGEKVPLQPLFNNFGEKPAFQKGDFLATFSRNLPQNSKEMYVC